LILFSGHCSGLPKTPQERLGYSSCPIESEHPKVEITINIIPKENSFFSTKKDETQCLVFLIVKESKA